MPLLDSVDGEVIRRIMRRITVDDNECWIFQGRPASSGHGQMFCDGRTRGTHVIMYVHHYGPVPEGLMVLHKCDVPLCCNPEHLEAGTRSKNATDAIRRGGGKIAKLTKVDADEIRLRYWAGSRVSDIARNFGVSRSAINSIISFKTWKDI
jgi:hypothetical protein